jgi:hypothetical protein
MAAGATYEPIATTTLVSAQATVTFSSFSGYTDLVLVTSTKGSTTNYPRINFNSDTGNNYSRTVLRGNGSTATSGRASNSGRIDLTSNASNSSAEFNLNTITQLLNYSNSTTYKTVLIRANNASDGVDATVGLWRNTNAITSIDIGLDTGTYAIGSTFTLYGIAAA